MGRYIQGPAHNKAQYIVETYNGKIVTQAEAEEVVRNDPTNAAICVVENGPFDAAAYAYNMDEFKAFTLPHDNRPKTWVIIPWAVAQVAAP
jgi:hypothetical protein